MAQSKMETAKAALQEARSQLIEAGSAIEVAMRKLNVFVSTSRTAHWSLRCAGGFNIDWPNRLRCSSRRRVLDLIELTDVYMILYLPEE